jgi:hypothetical protein
MAVMVAVASVRTALGLKGSAHVYKIGSEAAEHILDDMVGAECEELGLEFQWASVDFPDAMPGARVDWDLYV